MSTLVVALRSIHATADAACREAICEMVLNTSTSEDAEAADTLAGIVLLMDSLIEEQTAIHSKHGESPVAGGEQPIESTTDCWDNLLSLAFHLKNEQEPK